jgi:hypothetical protein
MKYMELNHVFRLFNPIAFVELDASILGLPTPAPSGGSTSSSTVSNKPRKIPLSSSDQLHAQLRDMNFSGVSTYLNQIAKRLSEDYEGRHAAKSISEIKLFISRLGGL